MGKKWKRKNLIAPVLYDIGIITAPDDSGVVTAQVTLCVITVLDSLDRNVIETQDDLDFIYRHLGEVTTEREKSAEVLCHSGKEP